MATPHRKIEQPNDLNQRRQGALTQPSGFQPSAAFELLGFAL